MPLLIPSSTRLHDITHTNPPSVSSAPSTGPEPPTPPNHQPIILAFPLPLTPHTTLRIQLTVLATSLLVFLTTTTHEATSSLSPLGSFVYSMPNRVNPTEPLCTALCEIPGSIDFARRLAKILARRTEMPAYVGWSGEFGHGEVEEEVQGLRVAVEGIVGEVEKAKEG